MPHTPRFLRALVPASALGTVPASALVSMRTCGLASLLAFAACLTPARASAATLPPHNPLRILIVSDEVNPHGLPAADLTQPGDISAALLTPGNGLNLHPAVDAVVEVATDDLPDATALLSLPISDPGAYDVLIYFAHRIPNGGTGAAEQADFVAAVDAFLVAGGGVISFHHGAYFTSGKEAIQDLIGGTATGAVPWNTVVGQDVINVAPGHFITTNEVEYSGTVAYSDVPRGIAADTYAFFNNTPDERYPSYQINGTAGDIEMLFASNYNEGATTHVLGFTHRRPEWAGVVVAYQPGEYQPNALDDTDGNNFQILANALFYAAYGATTDVPALTRGSIELGQNYPNPFNPITTLDFTLRHAADVHIAIFDVSGARVRTLVNGFHEAGTHRATWNGRQDNGNAAASGVYFCRMTSGSETRVRRMLLVK